jgi:hypothetical protein
MEMICISIVLGTQRKELMFTFAWFNFGRENIRWIGFYPPNVRGRNAGQLIED